MLLLNILTILVVIFVIDPSSCVDVVFVICVFDYFELSLLRKLILVKPCLTSFGLFRIHILITNLTSMLVLCYICHELNGYDASYNKFVLLVNVKRYQRRRRLLLASLTCCYSLQCMFE